MVIVGHILHRRCGRRRPHLEAHQLTQNPPRRHFHRPRRYIHPTPPPPPSPAATPGPATSGSKDKPLVEADFLGMFGWAGGGLSGLNNVSRVFGKPRRWLTHPPEPHPRPPAARSRAPQRPRQHRRSHSPASRPPKTCPSPTKGPWRLRRLPRCRHQPGKTRRVRA